MQNKLAPGARVEIRNEEWLVRRIDPSSDSGMLLLCDGVSELVRGRSALFLSKLEANIAVLDPAKTELVLDTSSHFDSTFLYLESQLGAALLDSAILRAWRGLRGPTSLLFC